ncbi:hypothetical protein C0J52_12272, partial [Blattella germanica]
QVYCLNIKATTLQNSFCVLQYARCKSVIAVKLHLALANLFEMLQILTIPDSKWIGHLSLNIKLAAKSSSIIAFCIVVQI